MRLGLGLFIGSQKKGGTGPEVLWDYENATSLNTIAVNGATPTFSRSSKAWGFVGGTLTEFAVDEPVLVDDGQLHEPERTNEFHDSFSPATQTRTLSAGTYTASLTGPGSMVLSGATSGTVTDGSPVTFTLGSSSNVTFTISGTVNTVNVEDGSVATTPIETPAASSATRNDGSMVTGVNGAGEPDVSSGCTLVVRDNAFGDSPIVLRDSGYNNVVALRLHDNKIMMANSKDLFIKEGGTIITDTSNILTSDGSFHTRVVRVSSAGAKVWEDGVEVYSDTTDYSTALANVTNLHVGYQVKGEFAFSALYEEAVSDTDGVALSNATKKSDLKLGILP